LEKKFIQHEESSKNSISHLKFVIQEKERKIELLEEAVKRLNYDNEHNFRQLEQVIVDLSEKNLILNEKLNKRT
jgi:hypothetical protein